MTIEQDKDYRGRVIYRRCTPLCFSCKKAQHFTDGKSYLVYGWDPVGFAKKQEHGYLRLKNDNDWIRLFSAKHFEMVKE